MTSLATAFGLGHGCFGREGVLRGTGTFPDRGGVANLVFSEAPWLFGIYPTGSMLPYFNELGYALGCHYTFYLEGSLANRALPQLMLS